MGQEIDRPGEKNVYEAYGEAARQTSITGKLLRFNKFGEFTAGRDKEPVPYGTKLIAIMPSIMIGWMKWSDEGAPDARMGLLEDNYAPPGRSELGDNDQSLWPRDDRGSIRDPWQRANTMIMVAEKDFDQQYTFSTTSKGGRDAVGDLCKDYGRHRRLRPNELPVVRLDSGSYRHPNRSFGEIRTPVFQITSWINNDIVPMIGGVHLDRDEIPF